MTQLKTLTYKVVVDTGAGKKDAKSFQTTLTAMGESGKQVDEKMQQLADTLGKDYNQKVTVARDQTKSQKLELQRMARETSRAEKSVDRLTREYQAMSAGLGKGADEQQILNAQLRLGTNATQAQKDAVRQLVSNYQKLRNETNKTQGSMRGFRGQMSNVGFQLQDVAVQAQMGTNAMVILGQQGSQLAGGFGPAGALIGAGIAFGAMLANVLAPSIFESGEEIEVLIEKLEKLKRTAGLTQDQADLLSRQKEKDIKTSQETIKTLDEELKIKQLAMDRQKKKLELDGLTFASMNKENAGYAGTLAALKKSTQTYDELSVSVSDINAKRKTEQQIIAELTEDIAEYNAAVGDVGSDTIEKWNESNKRIVNSLREKVEVLGLSAVQLLEHERAQKLSQLATQKADDAQVAEVQTYYAMLIARAQANEQIKEQNRLKAAQAKIDREAIRLNKDMAAQWQQQQNDMSKRLSDIENVKKRIGVGDLRRLETQYETEKSLLAGQTDALLKLDEEYQKNKLKLQGTSLQKYMISLEESINTFDEVATASITNFTKGFGQAVGNAVFESDSLGEAMQNIFKDVGKNMIAFFAEWAAQELILWGLKQALGTATQTSAAATMTANGAAQVLMSGLNAFSSTAAIPIIGPALAPGASAAAIGYTAPMAAALSSIAFAGALDKGGTIPQDAIGIMSEYRDELANGVLVRGGQGGTRVTSSEETARLMKGGSGGDIYNITATGNVTADQITRAIIRRKKNKGSKAFDDAVYDASERGSRNKGRRYARS